LYIRLNSKITAQKLERAHVRFSFGFNDFCRYFAARFAELRGAY